MSLRTSKLFYRAVKTNFRLLLLKLLNISDNPLELIYPNSFNQLVNLEELINSEDQKFLFQDFSFVMKLNKSISNESD